MATLGVSPVVLALAYLYGVLTWASMTGNDLASYDYSHRKFSCPTSNLPDSRAHRHTQRSMREPHRIFQFSYIIPVIKGVSVRQNTKAIPYMQTHFTFSPEMLPSGLLQLKLSLSRPLIGIHSWPMQRRG